MATPRLLDPDTTAAVLLGASDWTEAGLGRAPSFRRSARGVLSYLLSGDGLGLDPELVLDLFDDPAPAGDQLARMRDTLDELLRERRDAGQPVADVLLYYVGHGSTDDAGNLALLVRRSRYGLEGIPGSRLQTLPGCCASQRRSNDGSWCSTAASRKRRRVPSSAWAARSTKPWRRRRRGT